MEVKPITELITQYCVRILALDVPGVPGKELHPVWRKTESAFQRLNSRLAPRVSLPIFIFLLIKQRKKVCKGRWSILENWK